MNSEILRKLIKQREGLKLDFKREMYHFNHQNKDVRERQRGEFVKDILALTNGNAGTSGETAYLIIGADDKLKADGTRELFDIGEIKLDDKQLIDKLNKFCDPPFADIRCETILLDGKKLFVISVPPSPYLYETTQVLETVGRTFWERTVFVRRNETIGIASGKEREFISAEKKERFLSDPTLHVHRSALKEIVLRLNDQFLHKNWSIEELWTVTLKAASFLTEKNDKQYSGFIITPDQISALFDNQLQTLRIETAVILSQALEIPCDDLLSRHKENRLFLETILDPIAGEKIRNLIRVYEKQTGQLQSWSDFLPCSLESPEFMESHHQVLYGDSLLEGGDILIETFNTIGHKRREWIHSEERKANSSFTQLMFKSSLENIAYGKSDYENIAPEIRRNCLKFLYKIIADPNNRIKLIVAEDEANMPIKRILRQFDSILVFGNSFALRREHDSTIFYSASEQWINKHNKLFKTFRECSKLYKGQDMLDLLSGLINSFDK